MVKIVTVPNKILTTPTKPVDSFDNHLKKLIKEAEKTLNSQTNPQGVGLAAPQLGINLQFFIIKPKTKSKTEVFINPKVLKFTYSLRPLPIGKKNTKKSLKKAKKPLKLEGCLSIPKIWSPVARAKKILLEYQDLTCQVKREWFQGFKAIIIQHEVDHLNGILFTQRALEQKNPLYEEKEGKLKKLRY